MSLTVAPLVVAILGLGEAGSALARDLLDAGTRAVRDVVVRGWDSTPRGNIAEIPCARSAVEAVTSAHVALSVDFPTAARDIACSVAPALTPQCIYADLNTTTPALKREIAAIVEPTGALFADVALMGPAPWHGIHTPALAAGSGADQFQATFAPLGMPVDAVSAQAGDAAAHKLLRNVFMKGLAAAIIESLEATRHLGVDNGLRQDNEQERHHTGVPLLERLIQGSREHAVRRVEEMTADEELLRKLNIEPRVASAAADWLRQLANTATLHLSRSAVTETT